jgi:hypothetical protein
VKLLILKGLPEEHGYSQLANALQGGLREIGHTCDVLERPFLSANSPPLIQELIVILARGQYEAVVSFGSWISRPRNAVGESIYDALSVKFLGWALDHPIYLSDLLAEGPTGRFTVYPNPNLQRFGRAIGVPGPGAVILPGAIPATPLARDHRDRRWPIVIAAVYRGPPTERPWASLPGNHIRLVLDHITDCLLEDPEASLIDAWEGTAARAGLSLPELKALDPSLETLRLPLTFVRNSARYDLVRTLVRSGLPIAVCGSGWREELGDAPNVTYLDSIPFAEIGRLYGQARICINLNAGNGASERAVQAALSGAAVVSDRNSALSELLGEDQGVRTFHHGFPQGLIKILSDLLESGDAEAMGAFARGRVSTSGLWRHRAEQAVDLLGMG